MEEEGRGGQQGVHGVGGVLHLRGLIRESFIQKSMHKERLEGGEGRTHAGTRGRAFQAEA